MIYCDLKFLAVQKNKTFTEIHNETGISRNALTLLANGKSKGIQFDTLNKLCKSLNCSVSDLIKQIPSDYVIHMNDDPIFRDYENNEDGYTVLRGELYKAEIEKQFHTSDVMVNMDENIMSISIGFDENDIKSPERPSVLFADIPSVSEDNNYHEEDNYMSLKKLKEITSSFTNSQKVNIAKKVYEYFSNSKFNVTKNKNVVVILSIPNDVSSYTFTD